MKSGAYYQCKKQIYQLFEDQQKANHWEKTGQFLRNYESTSPIKIKNSKEDVYESSISEMNKSGFIYTINGFENRTFDDNECKDSRVIDYPFSSNPSKSGNFAYTIKVPVKENHEFIFKQESLFYPKMLRSNQACVKTDLNNSSEDS